MNCLVIFCFISLFLGTSFASPVLNRGTPAGENIVMYQDHLNPNLYYINPTTLRLVKNESGIPIFRYSEYREGRLFSGKSAILQFLLTTAVNDEVLKNAKTLIKTANPNATFSAMPFIESRLLGVNDIDILVEEGTCDHVGGLMGQHQDCTLKLTPTGRRAIIPSLKAGHPLALQFEYSVQGVIQKADASYEDKKMNLGIGAYIGGQDFLDHPEIFF